MVYRTTYQNRSKAKIALEAIQGDKKIFEIATESDVARSLVNTWKSELLAKASSAFGASKQKSPSEAEHKL